MIKKFLSSLLPVFGLALAVLAMVGSPVPSARAGGTNPLLAIGQVTARAA